MSQTTPTFARSAKRARDTGAEAVARALKAARVTQAFALCGDHVNALFHAMHAAGIEIIGARHESAAVQMADGYARASGKTGVAIVNGGPGHTNAITGAAVAQGAQSPVLVISGQADKARRERGGNQSLHQAELMRPVTKWAIEAESSVSLSELTMRALAVARTGTPGPVSLSIPVDTADAPNGPTDADPQALDTVCCTRTASSSDVASVATLLARARKPVLVLGGCALQHAPYGELQAAVCSLGVPVFTNGQARGVVPDDGDLVFGFASPLFNATFRVAAEADVWLIVGTTVDYNIASVVSPAATVVQVHSDPRQLGVGRLPALAVVGSPAVTLSAIAAAMPHRDHGWSTWLHLCQARYREQQAYWRQTAAKARHYEAGIHPVTLCMELQRHCTPDTTLVIDVGDFVNWPKAYFPALAPTRYMDGGALGNLGGALPIALGAQIARPAQPVWAFTGDGGFGFHSWELSLAIERNLPLKIIVGNDSAWGTEKRLQRKSYATDIACDLPTIRYDRYAALLGMHALHVDKTAELALALAELAACKGPCLLDVVLASLIGRPFSTLNA